MEHIGIIVITGAVVMVFFCVKGIFSGDSYGKGGEDFLNGYEITDNPYKKGTYNYDDWECGWIDEKLKGQK